MNKKELIKNTFCNPFDKGRYSNFLTELLNTSIYEIENINNEIEGGFNDYIENAYDYGLYTDEYEEELKLFVIQLKKSKSVERARTMQRNFIAKLLSNKWIDNALVAFYEENKDWRFSFIKINYEIDGKGNIVKKLTPAKRHSYLVGPTQSNHTCQKQFLNLVQERNISIEKIEDTFNVENVTEEFFDEYKRLYLNLNDSLNEVIRNDEKVKKEFAEKEIKISDFSKKLMGQLVFLYFLQRKGWLGVPWEKEFGEGPSNFLRLLYEKKYVKYENFFNDVLEPLFYQGFCEDVTDWHYEKFNCKIPFLNGGLFENINNYDWRNTEIVLENNIFKEIIDTFDRFNFTVKEDEPLEKEVAVDPEMLGKVFEKLLDMETRKDSGSYYTPRNIVHYMCKNTLISYLNDNMNISLKDIESFINENYFIADKILSDSSNNNIPKSIKENADEINNLLKNIKVADPAVGSGAFPVGMMNEIVKARQILSSILNEEVNTYELKRETIENSLYGVDISYSATNITKLRFWLSLIVDEKNIRDIKPLPNLDNHIMCGNSLIDEFEGIKIFDDSLLNFIKNPRVTIYTKGSEKKFIRLENKKKKYFNEKSPNEKQELKNDIKQIKKEFIEETIKESVNENISDEKIEDFRKFEERETKPFFIWELEFSEIFRKEKPGFDIVIGNPPYVAWNKIMDREYFEKGRYKDLKYSCRPNHEDAHPNLYMFFLIKSLKLSKGIISFILPQEWLEYSQDFRDYLLEKTGNIHILKFDSDYRVFKNKNGVVGTNSLIVSLFLNDKNSLKIDELNELDDKKVNSFLENNKTHLITHKSNKNRFYNKRWSFYSDITEKILEESEDETKYIKLDNKKYFEVIGGFQPNVNLSKAYVINNINNLNEIEKKCVYPCIYNSKNFKRYELISENQYWIVTNKKFADETIFKEKCPTLFEHLSNNLSNKNKRWWEFPNTRNLKLVEEYEEKLFHARTSIKNSFCYDDSCCVTKGTNSMIISKKFSIKYVLAIVNSSLANYFYSDYGMGYHGKTNKYEPKQVKLLMMPIKNINLEKQKPFIELVDKMLKYNKKYHTSKGNEKEEISKEIEKLDNQINNMVYNLYELSEGEIKIIEETS